jgi:hypothetical protein
VTTIIMSWKDDVGVVTNGQAAVSVKDRWESFTGCAGVACAFGLRKRTRDAAERAEMVFLDWCFFFHTPVWIGVFSNAGRRSSSQAGARQDEVAQSMRRIVPIRSVRLQLHKTVR